MAGWTWNVGNGISGSMSSSTAILDPVLLPPALEGNGDSPAKTEDLGGESSVGDEGERRARRLEKDDERPWVGLRRCCCGWDGPLWCSEDVMSMLPPPTAERLRSPERSMFSACTCSCVGADPCKGVIVRVPASCAYE
jgi:hypothetical protein